MGTTDKNGAVRWLANGMQLIGYYMLIHDGFSTGLFIKAISDVLIMYWGLRNKLWDVFIVTGIFCFMNIQRCYELLEGGTARHLLYSIANRLHMLG